RGTGCICSRALDQHRSQPGITVRSSIAHRASGDCGCLHAGRGVFTTWLGQRAHADCSDRARSDSLVEIKTQVITMHEILKSTDTKRFVLVSMLLFWCA